MSPILTTVFVTPKSTLLYGAVGGGTGPLQVVNLDSANTIYLSTQSNPVPNQPGTFPLAPLSSLAFDGSRTIYAITLTGNVIAGIVPGGEGYSPGALAISGPVTATISGPVTVNGNVGITGTPNVNVTNTPNVNIGSSGTVAIGNTPNVNVSSGTLNANVTNGTINVGGAVNATGVGGFILPGDVQSLYSSTTNQAVAPGTSFQPIALQNVSNYNSYDITLSVNDASQGVLNHAHAYQVVLQWFDDLITGIPVFTEVWCPWVGNVANAAPCSGTGPMHGKYLTISVNNFAGVTGNITINQLIIFGSGRTVQLSDWRQSLSGNISDAGAGWHIAPGSSSSAYDNMLFDTFGFLNLSANQSYIFPFNLYAGPMDWAMQIGAGGGLSRSNIVNIGSSQAANNQTSGNLTAQINSLEVCATAAGTNAAGSQLLPRAVCALLVTVGAANTTVEFTAVGQQGP